MTDATPRPPRRRRALTALKIAVRLGLVAGLAVLVWHAVLFGKFAWSIATSDPNAKVLSFSIEAPLAQATRVDRVTDFLKRIERLHGPLIDAHMAEWQFGDNFLGPAEYAGYMRLQVPPGDIDRWVASFEPLPMRPRWGPTVEPRAWWVTREVFDELEFFKPRGLSWRIEGWIGVHRRTGVIYAVASTG
jgi:hypothetical protein